MTHPIRYIEQAQCGVCNSLLRQERMDGDIAIVYCGYCDVTVKVPVRIYQAEIVTESVA